MLPANQTSLKHPFVPKAANLIQEISAFCEEAANQEFSSESIITSVKLLMKKYNSLQKDQSIEKINGIIRGELEKRCSIILTDDEVRDLWMG